MNIDEQIEVMQAFKAGKVIEVRDIDMNWPWKIAEDPMWDWCRNGYRIKKIIPKRWRAEEGGYFWYICRDGGVVRSEQFGSSYKDSLYAAGNYFKTEEQARASAIFFILNDKYEYSFPWIEDKPEVPYKGEYWCHTNREWRKAEDDLNAYAYRMKRWLKHPNGEGE